MTQVEVGPGDDVGAATLSPQRASVARTAAEVESLRERWARLPVGNVDADIDYFLTLVTSDPSVLRPHVIWLRRPAGDVAVVGRLVREPMELRVGYRRVATLPVRAIVVSFDGVLGASEPGDLAAITAALDLALRSGEADAVLFQQLDAAHPLRPHLTRVFPRWRRGRSGQLVVRWSTKLPSSWDEFLHRRSARSRRQLRADDSKFLRKHAGRSEVRRLDLTEGPEEMHEQLEIVASKAYQRGLGVGTDGSDRQRALMSLARERGWLRIWMLYLDGTPVAFWWGLLYSGVFTIGSPGFDPAHAKDRVGYFTLRRMLEDLCNDPDSVVLDFGHGDADYKARFATDSSYSSDALVFAARPYPLLVNALVSLDARLQDWLRSLVRRSGWLARLKSAWRARGAEAPREVSS